MQGRCGEGLRFDPGSVSGRGRIALEAGERVRVESIEGSSIYVRRIDEAVDWRAKELPDKRFEFGFEEEVWSFEFGTPRVLYSKLQTRTRNSLPGSVSEPKVSSRSCRLRVVEVR